MDAPPAPHGLGNDDIAEEIARRDIRPYGDRRVESELTLDARLAARARFRRISNNITAMMPRANAPPTEVPTTMGMFIPFADCCAIARGVCVADPIPPPTTPVEEPVVVAAPMVLVAAAVAAAASGLDDELTEMSEEILEVADELLDWVCVTLIP